MPEVMDNCPWKDYLKSIITQTYEAFDEFEKEQDKFLIGDIDIELKVALIPAKIQGRIVVCADMDVSRSQQVSTIPIPIRRRPGIGKAESSS